MHLEVVGDFPEYNGRPSSKRGKQSRWAAEQPLARQFQRRWRSLFLASTLSLNKFDKPDRFQNWPQPRSAKPPPRLASHVSGSSQNSNVGAPRGGRRLWSCSGGSFTTPRASSLSRRLRAAKSFNRPCLATHCHRWHNSRASRLRLHCEFPSIQPLSHLLSVADIRRPCNSISVSTSQRCHLRNLVVRPNHQHIRDAPLSGSWCVLGQTRRSHRGATMQALKHQAAPFHQQTSSLPRRRWRAW